MYGAIIGDIVGSKFEFNNIQHKDFPLFSPGCDYTDDSLMTIAVANALLKAGKENRNFQTAAVEEMQRIGRLYPHPQGAYGYRFSCWLRAKNPLPYNSFGNGSAMRVSPCAIFAVTLDEALALAEASAEVTHNHPEGIKGAKAVAAAIFLARTGKSKEEIRSHIEENYYPLTRTLDEIRKNYRFDESCQGTVPEAITAFLESTSFDDAIRNAVSIGGDSDTIGAITGSIAWAYYCSQNMGSPTEDMTTIWQQAAAYLPEDLLDNVMTFQVHCILRSADFEQTGIAEEIKL